MDNENPTDTELLDAMDRLIPIGMRWNFQEQDRFPNIAAVHVMSSAYGQNGIRDALRAAVKKLTPKREPGFYWVRYAARGWQIAQWEKGGKDSQFGWWLPGTDSRYVDTFFDEIGERVTPSPLKVKKQEYTGRIIEGRRYLWGPLSCW